jgi:hypothetical protein
VAYGCATFFDLTLDTYSSAWAAHYSLTRVFVIFIVMLALAAVINIFSSHLLALLNNVSVWWHVAGATAVVLILALIPSHQGSANSVFTDTVNNTGFFGGRTSGYQFFLFVVPLSFILTQYTITGYDASAHLSEETHKAADSAAKGIWRSIFYSGIGGWIVLLSFLFAVQDEAGVTKGGGAVAVIFNQSLTTNWASIVLFISMAGQFFCTVACMTSTKAFAIPIYLRWRAGDNFTPGGWTLGKRYRWMCPVAVGEIAVTSFVALMPTSTGGAPWYDGFAWKYVNYTPLVVGGALILLWIWWHASVKNWFKGPKTTIDLPEGMSSADEIAAEHHGGGAHSA